MVSAAILSLGISFAGCGTPGAPQPPSLNLPARVDDLRAIRTGNVVSLQWTMPRRNTDKLPLKSSVAVHLCRKESGGACQAVGPDLALSPGAAGAFTDSLPATLASGPPRLLSYFVELQNHAGRSAGLSNAAVVLAGAAPAPVTGLTAEVQKAGIVLRWNGGAAGETLRIERKLLTPPAKNKESAFEAPPEPAEEKLLVDSGAHPGVALDQEIRFGHSYEYRAQRVARVTAGGQTLELDGQLSAPVRVTAKDVFPPATPAGLVAVATAGPAGEAAIDLSWEPDSDPDLAGYAVYRRENGLDWRRISPAGSVTDAAFHDADVRPGESYHYAVSAIGRNGRESQRSAETEETTPPAQGENR